MEWLSYATWGGVNNECAKPEEVDGVDEADGVVKGDSPDGVDGGANDA